MIRWPRRRQLVRRLGPDEAALWRDLRLEALEHHPEAYGATHDDWAGRPLEDFAHRLRDARVFGVFAGGALAGSMALDVEAGGVGVITAVYLREPFRGRGLARAMLRKLEQSARAAGVQRLRLSVAEVNTAARGFYLTNGFHDQGTEPRVLARDGRFLEVRVMGKRLQ